MTRIKETDMATNYERTLGRTLAERLESVHMTDADRRSAVEAMKTGFLLAAGFAWVSRKIGALGGIFAAAPKAQH